MSRFILLLLSCLIVINVNSQSLFEDASMGDDLNVNSSKSSVEFNGYGRASVFGGGESYDIANAFAEISLQTKLKSNYALLNSDIRLRKGVAFKEDLQLIEFKELYAGYSDLSFDFLAGYQLVSWGRTDGFNPTNNLNPNDLFFLTSDPDDQIMSNLMLRLRYRFSSAIDIDIIGIPYFKPSNYRFDLFDLSQEMKLEEFFISLPKVNIDVQFNPLTIPEKKLSNSSLGARLNFDLQKIGFAISYFSGYDPFHGFDLDTFSLDVTNLSKPIVVKYSPKVYAKKTIGFDFAMPINDLLIKGEFAYNIIKNKDSVMYIPNSDLYYVFGVEKMWNDFVFIGQFIGRTVTDFTPLTEPVLDIYDLTKLPIYANQMVDYQSGMFNRLIFNQASENNYAVSLTLTKSFAYDTWNAEMTGYYNITTKEYLLRPKISWKINDYLSVNFGGSYMSAKNQTLFKFSSKVLNGVFAEMKVAF